MPKPLPLPPAQPGSVIALLGEALVDRLPCGPVAGGAPLNVARHLQALGLSPLLISRLNPTDPAGQLVLQALQRAGMRCEGLQFDTRHATGVVEVQMTTPGGEHRFLIQPDAAWDHLQAEPALAAVHEAEPAWLYFGTLAQRHATAREAICRVAGRPGPLRYLDLNLREGVGPALALDALAMADWLKVNEEELACLLRWAGLAGLAGLKALPELMQRFGLQRLILTRGARGYASFDAQGVLLAEGGGPLLERPLVDTVGAGDAFSACLLAACLQGKAWAAALALANRFAAALCGQAGASPSDPASFYPPWRAALAALPEGAP